MTGFEQILNKNLVALKNAIRKNLEHKGTTISNSTFDKIEIKTSPLSGTIYVPLWFPVFEKGRGKRKSNVYASGSITVSGKELKGLAAIIYKWMEKHSVFKRTTERGKYWEARWMTWKINKEGTKLFRAGGGRDIYTTLIPYMIENLSNDIANTLIERIGLQIDTINDKK